MDANEATDPALRVKRQADSLISGSVDRSIRFVVWLFGGVVLLTAAGVMAWSSLGNRVATLERTDADFLHLKDKRDIQWESQGKYNNANDQTITAMQLATKTLGEKVSVIEKRVDEIYPKVMFMDEMRQFGISNKEDFYRQHGYQAPSLNLAQPEAPSPPRRP